ncbi:hypothetical protein [uncultured Fibrobacter sp.]|uniref:hypothetical protein n=1 Tax=uncultured Fibrobacter sp. TaxID=261512 RepID=UPI00260C64EE|nr:hypothetical protein [uncultured Fibrobacter sp.]
MTQADLDKQIAAVDAKLKKLNKSFAAIEAMVSKGVKVSKEPGDKIGFTENYGETKSFDIESKDYNQISPKDIEKFIHYFPTDDQKNLRKKRLKHKRLVVEIRLLKLKSDFI